MLRRELEHRKINYYNDERIDTIVFLWKNASFKLLRYNIVIYHLSHIIQYLNKLQSKHTANIFFVIVFNECSESETKLTFYNILMC